MEPALLSPFNKDKTVIIQLSWNDIVRFNSICLSSDFVDLH